MLWYLHSQQHCICRGYHIDGLFSLISIVWLTFDMSSFYSSLSRLRFQATTIMNSKYVSYDTPLCLVIATHSDEPSANVKQQKSAQRHSQELKSSSTQSEVIEMPLSFYDFFNLSSLKFLASPRGWYVFMQKKISAIFFTDKMIQDTCNKRKPALPTDHKLRTTSTGESFSPIVVRKEAILSLHVVSVLAATILWLHCSKHKF